MKPDDRDDFDQRLRNLAPPVVPREEFQKKLRFTLRDRMSHRRQGRPLILIMVGLCLLILFFPGHEDELVSTDFRLHSHGVSITGQQLLRSYSGDSRYSKDPAMSREDLEAIHAMVTAGHEVLASVTGWTLAGKTYFLSTYAYKEAGKDHFLTRMSRLPPSIPDAQLLKFLEENEDDIVARARRNEAQYLGDEDRWIDMMLVRLGKWRFPNEEWGPVIYWEGVPLSPR